MRAAFAAVAVAMLVPSSVDADTILGGNAGAFLPLPSAGVVVGLTGGIGGKRLQVLVDGTLSDPLTPGSLGGQGLNGGLRYRTLASLRAAWGQRAIFTTRLGAGIDVERWHRGGKVGYPCVCDGTNVGPAVQTAVGLWFPFDHELFDADVRYGLELVTTFALFNEATGPEGDLEVALHAGLQYAF